MTDNEIIEALEKTKYRVDGVVTRGFYLDPESFNQIIDLINRQKAEIEKWKVHFQDVDIECERLEKENESLNTEVALLHTDYTYKFVKAKAKAEAYKEFAERLKEKAIARSAPFNGETIYLCDIDSVLSELEGDSK